jgi:hypothetical protein
MKSRLGDDFHSKATLIGRVVPKHDRLALSDTPRANQAATGVDQVVKSDTTATEGVSLSNWINMTPLRFKVQREHQYQCLVCCRIEERREAVTKSDSRTR